MFPCSGCGACCKRVGKLIDSVKGGEYEEFSIGKLLQAFPHQYNEAGVCEMLDNNGCKVYEDRPLICRVDDLMIAMGQDKHTWYKDNVSACNQIMDEDGIDKSYRIKWEPEEK
jgi:Fe-S-cluster containining protein